MSENVICHPPARQCHFSYCIKESKPKLNPSSSNSIVRAWFYELNWWCKQSKVEINLFTFALPIQCQSFCIFFSPTPSVSVCLCLSLSQFNFSAWIAALARLLTRRNTAKVVLPNVKFLPAFFSLPPVYPLPAPSLPPPPSPPAVPSWRQRCVAAPRPQRAETVGRGSGEMEKFNRIKRKTFSFHL